MEETTVLKDKSSAAVICCSQESGGMSKELDTIQNSMSEGRLERAKETEPKQDNAETKLAPAVSDDIQKTTPMKKILCLCDIKEYLPAELRRKVWTAYLQPPPGHFVPPNIKQLMKSVDALQRTDKDLYNEIIEAARWIPSVPQHLDLGYCFDHVDNIVTGSPKAVMYCEDWLNLQYLVIKLEFCDHSKRDIQGLCTGLRLGITNNAMGAFHHLFGMIWDNHELPKLKQVRYDLEYVDALSRDPECTALSSQILIKLFPMAESLWAEAVGREMNSCVLEAVRGLNVAHRVWKRCPPRPEVLDLITATGGQGDDFNYKKFEDIPGLRAETLKEADVCMQLAPEKDNNFKRGINMELDCEGCSAIFKSNRSIIMWPEEKVLTTKLYEDHVARSKSFHNNILRCGVNKLQEAKEAGLILDDEYVGMDKQVTVEADKDIKWGFVTKNKQKQKTKKQKKSAENAEEEESSINTFWAGVKVD